MSVVERLNLAIRGLEKGEPAKVKGLLLAIREEVEEEVFNLRKRNAGLELENAKLKQTARRVAIPTRKRTFTSEWLAGL